jgi:hypothetical protein
LLLGLLLMIVPPEAGLATVGRPAVLRPLIEAKARCSADPQLVIALTSFTPPRDGHAGLNVSLRTIGGRRIELGRVGIFPEQAFSASLADAKRFGFALPKGALASNPEVVVEVTAEGGSGAGARAVVGEARISPAPQERC